MNDEMIKTLAAKFVRFERLYLLSVMFPLVAFAGVYLRLGASGELSNSLKGKHFFFVHLAFSILLTLGLLYQHTYMQNKQSYLMKLSDVELQFDGMIKASQMRFLMLMVGGLITAIALWWTKEQLYAGWYAVYLITTSSNRPTVLKWSEKLRLKGEAKEAFAKIYTANRTQ